MWPFKPKQEIQSNNTPVFFAMADGIGSNVLAALQNLGGGSVSPEEAIKNTAVMRSVELISRGLAMLPLYIMASDKDGARVEAIEHPLYNLLVYKPNNWQTAIEFKTLMQYRALFFGEAVALKIRSGSRIVALQPLDPQKLEAKQKDDWSIIYKYTRSNGVVVEFSQDELFIVRGLSMDGVKGLSKVKAAAEVLETSRNASIAANAIFKNGLMAGGYLHSSEPRSKEVKDGLKASLENGFMGAINAGKVPIIDGFKFEGMNLKAVDAQHLEMRNHQIEEISRVFGVPRPLLMLDETSWGSGIEQLSLLFIQYTLAPWFIAWEQAVNRALLSEQDVKTGYYADFDETELLRGSMKDQAEYFSRALGTQKGWMSQDEVRNKAGLGKHKDMGADSITPAIAIGKDQNVTK